MQVLVLVLVLKESKPAEEGGHSIMVVVDY